MFKNKVLLSFGHLLTKNKETIEQFMFCNEKLNKTNLKHNEKNDTSVT